MLWSSANIPTSIALVHLIDSLLSRTNLTRWWVSRFGFFCPFSDLGLPKAWTKLILLPSASWLNETGKPMAGEAGRNITNQPEGIIQMTALSVSFTNRIPNNNNTKTTKTHVLQEVHWKHFLFAGWGAGKQQSGSRKLWGIQDYGYCHLGCFGVWYPVPVATLCGSNIIVFACYRPVVPVVLDCDRHQFQSKSSKGYCLNVKCWRFQRGE